MMQSMTNFARQSRLQSCLLAVITLLFIAHAPSAHGQGTMGMLPDPITSSELDGYADRLGLSAEQRRAIDRHFQEYRQQFRELRDGDIASFLREMQEVQGGGMSMPSRDDMDRLMRSWERARGRISSLDNRFFAMIQDALTDEQIAMVQRVQMARERTRYIAEMRMGMMTPVGDLSDVVQRLNVTPDELQRIDPLLADYERRLTHALQRHSRSMIDMMVQMYDALEDLGITGEEDMADPEVMQEMMEAMQQVMQDVFAKAGEQSQELRALNYRTYRDVVEHLDEHRRARFRDQFVENTFWEIHFLTNNRAARRLDAALELPDLDSSTRQRIKQVRDAFTSERDRLFDRTIRMTLDHPDPGMGAFMFGGEESDYQEQIQKLQTEARAIDQRAEQSLSELLPEGAAEQVTLREAEVQQEQHQQRQAEAGIETEPMLGDNDDSAATQSSTDAFLAGAINTRETAIYADMLGLSDDEQMLLEELHNEYIERFEAETTEILQRLSEATRRQWDRSGESRGNGDQVAEQFTLRRQAAELIAQIDGSFFDDLELVVSSDDIDRVRWARMRARALHGMRSTGYGQGPVRIDLAEVVRLLRWTPQQRQTIDAVLRDWEQNSAEAMWELFDSSMSIIESHQRFYHELQQMTEEDQQNWQVINERRQDMVRPYQQRARQARGSLEQLTSDARRTIYSQLGSEEAAAFEDAVRRRAHPDVYNDRGAVHTHLRRALNLGDLTEHQRDELTEMNLRYNAEYHELSEQMAKLRESQSISPMEFDEDTDWSEYMQSQSEYSRLEFERHELNGWVVRELRGVLTDQQQASIGGLPTPARPRQSPF